jgi:hypothetical protein
MDRLFPRAGLIGLIALAAAVTTGCPEEDYDSGSTAPSAEQRYEAALVECQQWAAACLYPGMSALYVQDWVAVYASPEFRALVEGCMRDRGYSTSFAVP